MPHLVRELGTRQAVKRGVFPQKGLEPVGWGRENRFSPKQGADPPPSESLKSCLFVIAQA